MARANSSPTLEVFQNISCYCLTIPCIALFTLISIFQNISCYCLTGRKGDKNGRNIISKHLMLLFNVFFPLKEVNIPTFQNISCYCLTFHLLAFLFALFISKHLMLLFNPLHTAVEFSQGLISKHLMLLFNAPPSWIDIFSISYFKTSHVIV